ncbi:flagellar export protein FliJ [Texcoconibacillus texcoconensis]|uniref:Flagellar FliJ protein n=1 Tax=Texcoconibacillus texcoconensis TaxID=1095777 RepID=A0A840QL37_9BACI|nr:flagellar export protein FliJ [Texcoconibacillus texcoconensis]MBB5172076.1 flagellar FliJ protein [Texcoconibacillus texcoconensis]
MTFQFSLQKVLEYKENEKLEAEQNYQNAMDSFENIATELYHVLKRKEELEESYEQRIKQGVPIADIQQIQDTLSHLYKKIDHLQKQTQSARDSMNKEHEILIDRSVDVKKYEKMKQRKYDQHRRDMLHEEMKQLDEISVQQFMSK